MPNNRTRLSLRALEDRLAPSAGNMDVSFGGDGIVSFNLPDFYDVTGLGVAVQADGKPVIVGEANSPTNDHAAIYRLNVDGTLDSSFSGDGFFASQFTGTSAFFTDVAIQPDGKIVATGGVSLATGSTVITARFNSDGTLDDSFSGDGYVTTDFSSNDELGWGIAVEPDGKIVVVGDANGFMFIRYTSTGALDTTFSLDGIVRHQPGGHGAWGRGVAVQADGKIIGIGGGVESGSPEKRMMLIRLNSNGTFDTTFNGDGIVTTSFPSAGESEGDAVAMLPDGRIAAVGLGVVGAYGQHIVSRYMANGDLDTSFSQDGRVLLMYEDNPGGGLEGVAVQPDGKIVAAGGVAFPHDTVVMRFNEDGTPDATFGVGNFLLAPGIVFTNAGGNDWADDVFIHSDGRIVTTGRADGKVAVVRYTGDITATPHPDEYEAEEDLQLSINAPGVIANDTIFEGSPQAVIAALPAHASQFELLADGSFTYTPSLDFNGTDSFTYRLVDGQSVSATATVTLNVSPKNDAPTALDDDYDVPTHSPLVVSKANGVLKNDTDVEGDTLHAALIDPPSTGNLELQDDGSFTFEFPPDLVGAVTFTYRVNDGTVDGTIGTATLTRPANQAPEVVDDEYTPPHRSPFIVNSANGVLKNDSDLNNDEMHVVLVDPPSVGSVNLADDGSFTFTYPASLKTAVTFTYKVNDGLLESEIATVTINRPPNAPPQAVADSYFLSLSSPLNVPANLGVLSNDVDGDGDQKFAAILTQPPLGTVTLQPDGQFNYVFPRDLVGSVSFTYSVNDATGEGTTGTVTLTRQPLVQATANLLTVIGSQTADLVRLRAGAKGAIVVEMQTGFGIVLQTVLLPAGIKKFSNVEVYLGDGTDRLDAAGLKLPIRVVGGAGDDFLRTGAGADIVFGDAVDGTGLGGDMIETAMGDDQIVAGNGRDAIDSGLGNDTVTAGSGGSFIDAGDGNDLVTASGGANYIVGGAGKDVLVGGIDADVLLGGTGNDLLVGGLGSDAIDGGAGADILFDGVVALVNPTNDSLTKVLSSYVPTKRSTIISITGRLNVTFDTGAADTLTGGLGTDWFWSNDGLDLLDFTIKELKNKQF